MRMPVLYGLCRAHRDQRLLRIHRWHRGADEYHRGRERDRESSSSANRCPLYAAMKIEWAMRWWQTIIDFGKQTSEPASGQAMWWRMATKMIVFALCFHVNYSIWKHFNFVANGVFSPRFHGFSPIWNADRMQKEPRQRQQEIKWHSYLLRTLLFFLSVLCHFFRCSIWSGQHFICVFESEDSVFTLPMPRFSFR